MTKFYLGAVCGTKGRYGIVFKDLPGCVSAGKPLDQVLAAGREALQDHINVGLEYGDPIPDPFGHTIDDVAAWLHDKTDDENEADWIGLYPVEVTVGNGPADVHVDIPRGLLDEIGKHGRDQRTFLIDAAESEPAKLRKPAA